MVQMHQTRLLNICESKNVSCGSLL